MKKSRRGPALRKLLDLCDDLQRSRVKLADPELRRDARTRLRRQVRAKNERLGRELSSYRFRGPLGHVLRELRLDPVHFQILATLLHRHVQSDCPAMEGRTILATVFDNSFDVLAGMSLLQDNGVLRAGGLIVLEDDDEAADDVLEARFRISEEAVEAFRGEIAGVVVDARRGAGLSYACNHEYLADLRILHNLYKHRSERIFHQDRWDRIHPGTAAPTRVLSRRIDRFRARILRRLRSTADAASFPAVRFGSEHQLTEEELIIVVHLLFRELFEGNAYADAAEMVRLISADEVDLVRNRRLMQPGGNLLRHEMIKIEAMIEGREMTGEVHLNDWAVNYLIGGPPRESAIDSDDRLDWHLYLKNLEDTQNFFRDLEKN